MLLRQDGGLGGARVDLVAEDGDHQVRALREVPVDRADPHAGLRGDLAHGGVDAAEAKTSRAAASRGVDVALRVGADLAFHGWTPLA